MNFIADSLLLEPAVNHFLHIPETLEKIADLSEARGSDGSRFSTSTGSHVAGDRGFRSVPVDILETAKSYTFFLDVPGLPKSEIQVTLEDEKLLVIKSGGKRKRENGEEEACKYLLLERRAGAPKFVRKFRLPEDANPSAISAKCENGVLTVTVEKLPPPEPKPKKVEVVVA